jgi:hypothetical protein
VIVVKGRPHTHLGQVAIVDQASDPSSAELPALVTISTDI